jgi:hypothetical protein
MTRQAKDSRRDLRRLRVAMQVTCGDATAVIKVGEEEPGGMTKTMRRRRRPAPREVARWQPATSLRGEGDDRMQQRYTPERAA